MNHRLVPAFLLLLMFLAVPAAGIDLFVRSPRAGQVVFGPVAVDLEVLSEAPVVAVEIHLNGESVAVLKAPPFRTVVDVGEENRAHTFAFTVTDIHGATTSRTLVTGQIEVHEEVDLGLQQLYVTVTRGADRVLHLAAESFDVLDNDQPQDLVTFERGDVPLTAVLLIDSSLSMRGAALRAALAGARTFVENMQAFDEAKILVFSDRLLAATPFTADPAAVGAVMDTVEAAGGTAVNDHLYLALSDLSARQGRRVIILLSDGVDVESVLDMADVAWKARRTQSLMYWIRPAGAEGAGGSHFSVWRGWEAYRLELETLAEVVRSSGGSVLEIGGIGEVAGEFQGILRELREQYVVGYYPRADRDDGAWHEVEVKVRSAGVRVRARGGYFDDPP